LLDTEVGYIQVFNISADLLTANHQPILNSQHTVNQMKWSQEKTCLLESLNKLTGWRPTTSCGI